MTPEQRHAYLLETIFVPSNRLVTIGMIREDIGLTDEQYRLVRGSLETAIATLKASDDPVTRQDGIDLQDALSAMLSGGTSISKANRQETIDRLAAFGKWPDEVRDAVKGLGGSKVSRWMLAGYEAEPTLADIEQESLADFAIQLSQRIEAAARLAAAADGATEQSVRDAAIAEAGI